jgi:hypothetical protein
VAVKASTDRIAIGASRERRLLLLGESSFVAWQICKSAVTRKADRPLVDWLWSLSQGL